MARGRFISTSIAEDDRLSRLSLTAELLYLKTIPHLDRDGMISGRAGLLWGKVCPLREELINEMQRAIDGWVQVSLVIRMSTDEGPVLFFPGFLKNNTLLHYDRETPSKFPVPPGYERTVMGLVVEGTEQKKKPTKKPKEAQVPPSSNRNGAGIIDAVNELVKDTVIDFTSKGEVEVEVEVKDQSQVEVKAQAQDVRTAPAAEPLQDDGLDPKALIADLRQRQFMYLDKDATKIAARLIADFGWPRVMEAADRAETMHKAKIASGESGISAPLAYIRSVLAGTPNGQQQARGVPSQTMGEASVDKFLARYQAKGH